MTLDNLVIKGYLPEELLPVFTAEDLKPLLPAIVRDLDLYNPLKGRSNSKKVSKCVTFSIPKASGYRRTLSIPNPLHYIRLSNTIVNHWADIILHTESSIVSGSTLTVGSLRAIEKPSFEEFINQRIIRAVGNRYVLKIDISRFYNSIYTHSIPWALHTKSVSKRLRTRVALFGNALDEDCRRMQDGQTMGIPVGPDASRVISEIILTAIDKMLTEQLPEFNGIRIIDDYYLYFNSLADVEIARSLIHKILNEYELELNPSKDAVSTIPEMLESPWYTELKIIRFSNIKSAQRKEIISFFDRAVFHAKKYPEDSVISYAISKVRSFAIHKDNLIILQSLLLNSILLESKAIALLTEILITYHKNGYTLNLVAIKNALQEFISFHADLDNEFEIFWALWAMKSLTLKVDRAVADKLTLSKNPIVILVVLHLRHSRFISRRIDVSEWETLLTEDNLYNEYWLVAYEVKLRGWLTTPDDYLENDPFFKLLKDNNVHFYKPRKTLSPSRAAVLAKEPSMAMHEDAHDLIFSNIIRSRARTTMSEIPTNPAEPDLPF